MSSHEANNRPQTVEKDGEFALKLHTAKNRGKGRGDRPKLRRKHLYFSNLLSSTQRKWLKRRQAIEPIIGHVKQEHGMRRCWLKGQIGDALHAVLCAAGYNLRWLLRAIVRLGLAPIFFVLAWLRCWFKDSPEALFAPRATV